MGTRLRARMCSLYKKDLEAINMVGLEPVFWLSVWKREGGREKVRMGYKERERHDEGRGRASADESHKWSPSPRTNEILADSEWSTHFLLTASKDLEIRSRPIWSRPAIEALFPPLSLSHSLCVPVRMSFFGWMRGGLELAQTNWKPLNFYPTVWMGPWTRWSCQKFRPWALKVENGSAESQTEKESEGW